MENGIKAAFRLKEGLAHHDRFGAQPDEAPVYISAHGSNTLHKLPYGSNETSGQFALGDLRDLLQFFIEQGYV